MIRNFVRASIATILFAVLTGLVYPLAMTGFAQVVVAVEGGRLDRDVGGKAVGSSMIGQQWNGKGWFYGRPSAVAYDASTSSGIEPRTRRTAPSPRTSRSGRRHHQDRGPYHAGLDGCGDPGRSADLVGERPGPGHLAGRGQVPGAPDRRRAEHPRPR